MVAAEPVDFNSDVRPILSDTCFACHGPDAAHREADLRLDIEENAVGAGVIVAGNPADSALVQRITATDPSERMPPAEALKKLTPEEVDTLTRWVADGARYAPHWAYVKPKRTEPTPIRGRCLV